MGAVFALGFAFFAFIVVFIGVTITLFGIGGEALFATLMVRGKRFGKPLLVVSAVVTRIGALVALIPIVFFGLIVGSNFTYPHDFVETEIAVELTDGYWGDFVADGATYTLLNDLGFAYETAQTANTPVFHYIPDEAIERHTSFNFYPIINDSGYELIVGEYSLYCRAEDKAAVTDYYSNCPKAYYHYASSYDGRGNYSTEYYRLDSTVESEIHALYSQGFDSLEFIEIVSYEKGSVYDTIDYVYIDVVSEDGAVLLDYVTIVNFKGTLYVLEYEDFAAELDAEDYFATPEYERMSVYGLRVLPEATEALLKSYFIGE